MDEIKLKASIIEANTAQLRAEALNIFHKAGEEFTEKFDAETQAMMESKDPIMRLFGLVAQIGFCEMLTRAVETMDEE